MDRRGGSNLIILGILYGIGLFVFGSLFGYGIGRATSNAGDNNDQNEERKDEADLPEERKDEVNVPEDNLDPGNMASVLQDIGETLECTI